MRNKIIVQPKKKREKLPTEIVNDSIRRSHRQSKDVFDMGWAIRLKRTLAVDVSHCPKCNGKMKLVATFEKPNEIQKELQRFFQQEPPEICA